MSAGEILIWTREEGDTELLCHSELQECRCVTGGKKNGERESCVLGSKYWCFNEHSVMTCYYSLSNPAGPMLCTNNTSEVDARFSDPGLIEMYPGSINSICYLGLRSGVVYKVLSGICVSPSFIIRSSANIWTHTEDEGNIWGVTVWLILFCCVSRNHHYSYNWM